MKRLLPTLAILGQYTAALYLPVANMEDVRVDGLMALSMGWNGLGIIVECSNLVLLAGLIAYLSGEARIARASGFLAFGLGLCAPAVYGVPIGDLRSGYALWLGSSLVLALAAWSEARTAPVKPKCKDRFEASLDAISSPSPASRSNATPLASQ
jgi:hypothetical protein